MPKGKLIIITGPSAVGKTTIARKILEKMANSTRVITYTTRDMRNDETDGIDYNFISKKEFTNKIKDGFFIEWAIVYKQYYGNSGPDIQKEIDSGKYTIIVLDPQGAKTIKEKMPNSLAFFIMPESIEQLSQRLWSRSKANKDKVKTRLDMAKNEIETYKPVCDFSIINKENQLEVAVNKIIDIIYDKS